MRKPRKSGATTIVRPIRGNGKPRRTWPRALALSLLPLLGAGLWQYPVAQDWFSVRDQRAEVTGYASSVETMSGAGKDEAIERARKYNEDLVAGLTAKPGTEPDNYYFSQLNPGGDRVMAHLVVPRANISVPVYHTVDEIAISRGAGHLFGSSLPVGGPTTHAVLSSHSGLVDARLFTHLKDLDVEDTFSITVLDLTLYYKVIDIKVVLPQDVSAFTFEPGRDLVTLVTCTPTGVNSHRLLVTGERMTPPTQMAVRQTSGAREVEIPFPWWAVIVPSAWVGGYLLVIVINRPKKNYVPVYLARAEAAREWGSTPAEPFGKPLTRKQMNENGKLIWERGIQERRAARRGRWVEPKRPLSRRRTAHSQNPEPR